MPKQGLLILSVMLIVFSLTLIGGAGLYMFFISPMVDDIYIHAGLYWTGAFIGLFGLAGFLAGLVGVMSAVLLRTAELKEQEAMQEEMLTENREQERR